MVGGEWVDGPGPQLQSTNSAEPDETIAVCAQADAALADTAVAAARKALADWDAQGLISRGLILRQAAIILGERTDQIAQLMTTEEGKTLPESRGEIGASVETLHYHAASARFHTEQVFTSSNPAEIIRTIRRPFGVVGVITP